MISCSFQLLPRDSAVQSPAVANSLTRLQTLHLDDSPELWEAQRQIVRAEATREARLREEMRNRKCLTTLTVISLLALSIAASVAPASAQTETILYSFTCQTDGCPPQSGVVVDSKGNLFGTTSNGGVFYRGAVFELTPSGTFSILYSFTGNTDGSFPYAGLAIDSNDNLYGTTSEGGVSVCGIIFKVTPAGVETVLHDFTGGTEPCYQQTGVVLDAKGNIYGTGYPDGGAGSVFKLTPSGTFTTLYSFKGGSDGNEPDTGLALDNSGNVYGTTTHGGAFGFGTVFKVTPSGKESVLHSFNPNGVDGLYPDAGVILDSKDNIYGTTTYGGSIGVGTLFKLTPSGAETILHNFTGRPDAISPGNLAFDKTGNLYGVSGYGGSYDLGTIFEFTSSGVEKTLHSFSAKGTDGYFPFGSGLSIDNSGNLYDTTQDGGSNHSICSPYGCGVIFKLVP